VTAGRNRKRYRALTRPVAALRRKTVVGPDAVDGDGKSSNNRRRILIPRELWGALRVKRPNRRKNHGNKKQEGAAHASTLSGCSIGHDIAPAIIQTSTVFCDPPLKDTNVIALKDVVLAFGVTTF
jgi:hypothetical protein